MTCPTACSSGQIVVGSSVLNLSVSTPPGTGIKPFTLKIKTNQIRICQAGRKDFSGPNDTMGLVVARAERRIVSNVATGVSFLGRESNSHYHLHLSCINKADPTFKGTDLHIPATVKSQLNILQKLYLTSCFNVPV